MLGRSDSLRGLFSNCDTKRRPRRQPVRPTSLALALLACVVLSSEGSHAGSWTFVEITTAAGFNYAHGYVPPPFLTTEQRLIAPGIAVGDYDGDGWADLYAVRGDIGPNLLFRNQGDGTFQEVGQAAGVALMGALGGGATFADIDGDGDLDLLVGGVEGTPHSLFRNLGNGTFADATATLGLDPERSIFSATFGDFDNDNDLDLALGSWSEGSDGSQILWTNDGTGHFTDATDTALGGVPNPVYNFTPNFVDLNGDPFLDLVTAADFGTSWAAINQGDGTFQVTSGGVLSDENGMGATVADYDGDGDLDWFVSSIWDPDGIVDGNWGITGNRLYRNDGQGGFEDVTDVAGVREGYWGWGSCFGDFDNDGTLDLFHVNGFNLPSIGLEFHDDPARMFVGNGNGTFTERSVELGVDDTGQGRGIVCFDYDHDGDLDLFIANNQAEPSFYRNDSDVSVAGLGIQLRGSGGSTTFGIGSTVRAEIGSVVLRRDVQNGSNYASQNPPGEVHFGLGAAHLVDRLVVDWPGGSATVLGGISPQPALVVSETTVFADGFETGSLVAWD